MVLHSFANPFSSVCFCLGHYGRKINVTVQNCPRKKWNRRNSNWKKASGHFVYRVFLSKCNLVLFADIGYRLYVHSSITHFGQFERREKKSQSFFPLSFLTRIWHKKSFVKKCQTHFLCLILWPHRWWFFRSFEIYVKISCFFFLISMSVSPRTIN